MVHVDSGADCMGAMEAKWGRSPPRPKNCGSDALKSPPQEFCYVIFWNSKMFSKIMNVSLCQWQNLCRFQPENAPKAFGGRASSGPAGKAYSASQLDLMGRSAGTRQGAGEKTGGRGQLMDWGRRTRGRGMDGGHSSRIRILRFFGNPKNATFYVFLKWHLKKT